MANFRHGKNAYLAVVIGGTTTTLSTAFDDSSLQRAVDTAEVTAYGNGDKVYLAGLRGGTHPVSGHFNKSPINTLEGQLGASTNPTFHYGPEGNTTGYTKYEFAGVIGGLDIGSPVGDKVSASYNVTISGAVTSTEF